MDSTTKVVILAAGLGVTAYVLYRSVPQIGKAAAAAGQAVNPLNPDNVFASATNKVGAALTGDTSFSLGSWLYDVTHPGEAAQITGPTSSAQTRPIDFGYGTGWEVTNGAAATAPLGQVTGGW